MQTWPGRPGVGFERDVVATMRDGTRLFADVYRPSTDDDVPVLLIRSPYDKRPATAHFGNAHPVWYAEQGYQVVVQDVRGRAGSEGEFYPYRHEQADGYDTVEWAAEMPGSNGQVGMWGFSYTGATQLLAAVERPPGLRTILPGFTASQYYDGWTYNGGVFATAFLCYWANLLALDTAARADDEAGWNVAWRSYAAIPRIGSIARTAFSMARSIVATSAMATRVAVSPLYLSVTTRSALGDSGRFATKNG